MQYIIVESISAFNYAKKIFKKADVCWASSSPKVCNFFSINKFNYIEIEKLVIQKELDEIEKISKNICEAIISESNNIFIKKKYLDLRYIAGAAILKKIYSIIYKNYLLNKILSKTKKNLICVGNSDLTNNFNYLGIETFDNIFTVLGNCFKKKIKIIEYKENTNIIKKNILKNSDNFFLKKIISFLNSNYSVFLFKILKHLSSNNFFKNFLNKKDKKQLLIMNETDHISFSFSRLLRKYDITFFNENFRDIENIINKNKDKNLNNKFYKSYVNINYKINKYLKNSSLKKNQIINYEKGLMLVLTQIYQYLQSLDENSYLIENKFKKIISQFKKDFCIISNNANKFMSSIFVSYCQNMGTKFFSFEHGLRGISRSDKTFSNYYQQYKGNYGIYYWKKSAQYLYPSPNQKKIIDGFPFDARNNFFKFLFKRVLIKINLKISIFQKTIVFLSDLERNNDNYPKCPNDYKTVKNNKEIIKFLAKKYPKKIIVLKLYPTQKYLDIYNYQDLANEFKNVRILRDISFDYLTDIFDEIYISHASSTLLRCMSSKAKVYFLKTSNNDDIKTFIKKKIKVNINNVKSCYLLNRNLNKISYNWINFLG